MLDEAEKLYKELLNIRPDDVNVLNLIGLLYLAKHNTTEAINYLSRAYILKKSAYIASNLAKAYYFNSEPEKAIKIYKQALSYEENDDIYYSIALAYKKLNDYENIILNYKKAIEINPKNYSALYNLSLAYKDIKDINNAIFYAEKCIEIRNGLHHDASLVFVSLLYCILMEITRIKGRHFRIGGQRCEKQRTCKEDRE